MPAAPTPAESQAQAQAQAQVVTGETTAPEVKATKQQGAPERETNFEYVTNMCKISFQKIKTNIFKQYCIRQMKKLEHVDVLIYGVFSV